MRAAICGVTQESTWRCGNISRARPAWLLLEGDGERGAGPRNAAAAQPPWRCQAHGCRVTRAVDRVSRAPGLAARSPPPPWPPAARAPY